MQKIQAITAGFKKNPRHPAFAEWRASLSLNDNHHRFFCIQASASFSFPQVFWTPTQSFLAPSYIPEAAPFMVSQPCSANKNAEKTKSASAFFNIKASSSRRKRDADLSDKVGRYVIKNVLPHYFTAIIQRLNLFFTFSLPR